MSMFSLFTLETPTERLDRLVLEGILMVAEDGYDTYCYLCSSRIRTEGPFEDNHQWFHDGAMRYMTHVSECSKRVHGE